MLAKWLLEFSVLVIVLMWRAGLDSLLIQGSNEKRKLVEGSSAKKAIGSRSEESLYSPRVCLLLRVQFSNSGGSA